jgi:hypothetical protein
MKVSRALYSYAWHGFTLKAGQFFGHTDDRRHFVTNGKVKDGKIILYRQSEINNAWNLTTESDDRILEMINKHCRPTPEQAEIERKNREYDYAKRNERIYFPDRRPCYR